MSNRIPPSQLEQEGATDGQVLSWNNATGKWTSVNSGSGGGGGAASNATYITKNNETGSLANSRQFLGVSPVSLDYSASGSLSLSISSSGADKGDYLTWDGSAYVPSNPSNLGQGRRGISLTEYYGTNGNHAESPGDFTLGYQIKTYTTFTAVGIRAWVGNSASRTYRLSLWTEAGSRITFVDVTSAGGYVTGTFSSPQNLAAFTAYRVSIWETAGVKYAWGQPLANFDLPATNNIMQPWTSNGGGWWISAGGYYAAGDAFPNISPGAFVPPIELLTINT